MTDFDDILEDFDDIIPAGDFDDILGPTVPDKYKKESINRRLIEAYKRVCDKDPIFQEKFENWENFG